MKNELVSVEYNPKPVLNNNPGLPGNPICGSLGETLRIFLEEGQEEDIKVPVRFPLTGIGSYTRLLYHHRDPSDLYQLNTEGVLVNRKWLFATGKKPISNYELIPWEEDPRRLTGTESFLRTYSKDKFIKDILELAVKKLRFGWRWKREYNLKNLKNLTPTFVEARVYGLDAVLPTISRSHNNGFAIQVIYRPWPTTEELSGGTRIKRTKSDVYVFTSSEEYISYVDGVEIDREPVEIPLVIKRFSRMLTPKETMKTRIARKKKSENPKIMENPKIKADKPAKSNRYQANTYKLTNWYKVHEKKKNG